MFDKLKDYLFIIVDNTNTNYILIIYELSNFDLVQIRVSGDNRTHESHANSLAHYPQDYQGTH